MHPYMPIRLQWGQVGLEAAFGVYMVERLHGARALRQLLALQLFHLLEAAAAAASDGAHICLRTTMQC